MILLIYFGKRFYLFKNNIILILWLLGFIQILNTLEDCLKFDFHSFANKFDFDKIIKVNKKKVNRK